MKKLFKLFVLTFAILAIVAFSACSTPKKPNEDKFTFNISESVKTIKEYDTFYLTTDYEGEETVSYVSGNSGVATVDDQGLVTGVSVGETTITVTIKNVSKVCYLTVEEDTSVPVLSLENVEGETISLNIQDEFDLGAVVKNNGVVVSANLTFESENQQVATVSNVGVVSAVGVGETVINVSGEYRGKPLSAEVAVSVERKVSFNLTIEEDTIYAVAELNGENFVNTTRAVANLVVDSVTITNGFTFESEDQEIATVDESGNVVAKKVGETKIYCYYQLDGEQIYAYKTLTVDYAVVDYNAEVLVEKSEEVTTAIFDELFIDEQTVIKVLDVADTEIEIEISDGVLNEETLKSFTGDRAWRIYNQAYAYNVKVVVADYVIGTADKFKEVMPTLTSEYVILSQNISGVGKYTNNKTNTFTGVFDGRGYTISNVEIANNGIFTYVLGATVKNLAITNAKVGQLSSVFAIQIDGLTLDNVYVKIDSMGYDETNPSGAIGVQIGGVLTVNNSLVIVDGIDANSNAGAIAGAWWGGSVSLSNAYFITEGNPYGKVLIKDTNNKLGKEENAKGSWSYIYASVAAFAAERKATDSKINLNDFNDCWEMNTGDHPFFNSDLNTKYSFSNSYIGSYNGGELYMFGKNESDTEYQIPVTVAQTQLKTLLLGGIELSSATFKDGKITVSKTEIAEIANGEYQMVMDFGTEVYKSTVTVADYVITTEMEFKSVFSGTGLITSYVVLANDITFTSSFVGHQGVFSGTFNGKGYALKNLTIPEAGIGLFSEMNGQVKNLAILNVTHNGDGAVLANQSRGLIDNVIVTGIAGGHSTLANVMYSGTVSNSIVIVEQNARNVETSASIVRSMKGTATNCFAVSKSFVNAFNNPTGTVNNCDIKTSAEDLVALFNGTLPAGFNAYWSLSNGNLKFGDEIIVKNTLKLTNAQNVGGQLFYFGKDTTDCADYARNFMSGENYVIQTAIDLGTVESVKIGTTAITGFAYANKQLTIPVAQIASLANGDAVMEIVTATADYSADVTIADYVITTETEYRKALGENGVYEEKLSGYFVLASDIDFNNANYAGHGDGGKPFAGTLDGKGYAIKNITLTGNGLIEQTGGSGVIKNLAIINATHTASNVGLLLNQHNGKVENVFVSGLMASRSVINVCYASGKISNVIVDVEKVASVTYTGAVVRTLQGTATNCYATSDTFTTTYHTSTGTATNCEFKATNAELLAYFNGTLPTGFNSYWTISNGSLSFGNNVVMSAN